MKSFDRAQDLKVALVHDYLREYGGAERVVEALHEIFPEAPLYTAYYNPKSLRSHKERFKGWDIRTSWMQKIPWANKLLSPFRIIAPLMFRSFDLSEFDVVISSSAIYYAHAVKTAPQTLHLAYIHTPPRYLYNIATSYEQKKHNFLLNFAVMIVNHLLRMWDFELSQRPNILLANSQNTAARIKKFYRREAVVVYPPVETDKEKFPIKRIGDYYLSLSRLWKVKGVEETIRACQEVGALLKVAGVGPELENLRKIGQKSTQFLGEVSDEEKFSLYANARALIAAAKDEDFGITLVEAQACGTPVVALESGGYVESIVPGKTGEFFKAGDLAKTLRGFNPDLYNPEDCRRQAERFSKERFKEKILDVIEKTPGLTS